jgi:hypothetical protein
MRKTLISTIRKSDVEPSHDWLDLGQAARVEVTSEAHSFPIEGALLNDGQRGWRASVPGVQTIRLVFDRPQTIRLIRLVFKEAETARTQEFVLRWLAHGADVWREVVRQQWNFSPPNTIDEYEEYNVELSSAAALELSINPDISKGGARASLEKLRVSVRE